MIDTTLADFNCFVRQFGARTFLVAGRCYDLAPDKFDWYACAWYQKNGLLELPNDRYIGKHPKEDRDIVRYHSIDELLLSPPAELEGIGKHIYEGWQGEKIRLAKIRNADPVVILPPPPEPPKAKPVELPPKEDEPKKQRSETVIKLGVWLTVLTPVMMAVSFFIPPPWNMVAKAIFEAIKLLIGG